MCRMTNKPSQRDRRADRLRIAILRIEKGQSAGEARLSISAVAREAGVSPSLIHNSYPDIAELIRSKNGIGRRQREKAQQDLTDLRDRNRLLREEVRDLRKKIAQLASLNEMLEIRVAADKAK